MYNTSTVHVYMLHVHVHCTCTCTCTCICSTCYTCTYTIIHTDIQLHVHIHVIIFLCMSIFFLSPCSYLFPNGEDYNPDLQETLSAAPDKHITVSKSCWKIDISFLSLTFGETDRER